MDIEVKNMRGEKVDTVELPPEIFEAPINEALMHQALLRQLANARLGTHSTKGRGEVHGGGAKPWRQKGTGRARHGSRRSPIWVGGGKVHTPKPRSYRQRMPRQMRRAALRSALSVKAAHAQIVVLDALELPDPKTSAMLDVLSALGTQGKALFLLPEKNEAVERSVRNLPAARTLNARYLNVRDLLGHDMVIMPVGALEVIRSYLGSEA